MLVKDLSTYLAPRRGDEVVVIDLGDIDVTDDGSAIKVGTIEFTLDELGEKALASFIKVPYGYLKKCDPEFKAVTIKHWCQRYAEVTANILVEQGQIVAVKSPDEITVPNEAVAEIVTSVFQPDDNVRVYQDFDSLHLDVISFRHEIEVANPDNIPFRPLVGDITRGGVRILTKPHHSKEPVVSSFFERLVCMNGMTTPEHLGQINIKGTTVAEVTEEMEKAARRILAGLEGALERYAATATIPVPGSLQAFAHQLAVEYKLKREILDAVMVIINQLPESATVYDVVQAFTVVTHDLPYAAKAKLETLGGMLALDTERMIKRCTSCERLLP